MVDKFLVFIKENKLVSKSDKILLGVSGGIDSVVLLDILSKLQKKMRLKLAVAHVNYGLRKESDRDNKFVKDLAKKYGLQFFEKKVKLKESNIEEEARDIRYSFFYEIANKEGFNKIAIAHHKNDLVETFFLNLSRGSGLTGLVSMRPRSGNLIRPLLFTTRKEIESYAKKNKLQFVEDVTNQNLQFKRNLIRHKVIPVLEQANLDFISVLSREIEDLRKIENQVSKITARHFNKLAKHKKGTVSFSVKELFKLNPYLQSEILRESIRSVRGDLKNISRKNIEDILGLIKDTAGMKEIHLREGLIVKRIYDKLEFEKAAKIPPEKPKSIRLEAGKKVVFGGWELFFKKTNKKYPPKGKNLVFLDIQKTPTLYVRCRKPGDRIGIGGGKTKSLQDVFVDAKIPRGERDAYPVVTAEDGAIVWIPGLRLDPDYRAAERSAQKVILKAEIKNEKTN